MRYCKQTTLPNRPRLISYYWAWALMATRARCSRNTRYVLDHIIIWFLVMNCVAASVGSAKPCLSRLLRGCAAAACAQLLQEQKKWIATITDSPKPPPMRITMTYPLINQAHCAAFVATGAVRVSGEYLLRVRIVVIPA